MSRQKYIEASRRVIAAAEARAETYQGDCETCRYFRGKNFFRLWEVCRNPIVRLAAENAERGHNRERIARCDEQRGTKSFYGEVVCGPNGTLWEPR